MLRHAWLLILCLLAASLVATASVHAQESYGAAMGCGGTVHADGDRDQVPADADQSVPHHHGACHGHSLTAPATSPSLLSRSVEPEAPNPPAAARLTTRLIGPALEPPRA